MSKVLTIIMVMMSLSLGIVFAQEQDYFQDDQQDGQIQTDEQSDSQEIPEPDQKQTQDDQLNEQDQEVKKPAVNSVLDPEPEYLPKNVKEIVYGRIISLTPATNSIVIKSDRTAENRIIKIDPMDFNELKKEMRVKLTVRDGVAEEVMILAEKAR